MLSVVIMPFSDLDIQDIIIEVFDVLEVLCEHSLELIQVLSVFWTLGTSKDRHALCSTLPCELELSLTNLIQVFAPLNESLVLCKDGLVGVKLPTLSRRVLFDHFLRF